MQKSYIESYQIRLNTHTKNLESLVGQARRLSLPGMADRRDACPTEGSHRQVSAAILGLIITLACQI